MSRNFNEIFFKEYKNIKDKNLDVLNGLKVLAITWIIMGQTYIATTLVSNSEHVRIASLFNNFFTQVAISSTFALALFYFISAFTAAFGIFKKFVGRSRTDHLPADSLENEEPESALPTFNFVFLLKLIFQRWWRLAFPAYFVLLIAFYIFPVIGYGPLFWSLYQNMMSPSIKDHWPDLLFLSNWIPFYEHKPGLYWFFYLANDL